jgi:hypothetical protein
MMRQFVSECETAQRQIDDTRRREEERLRRMQEKTIHPAPATED